MSHNSRAGAPSRDQQAFRWLLDGDDDEDGPPAGRRQSKKGGSGSDSTGGSGGGRRRSSGAGAGSGRTPYIPGFRLRSDAAAEADAAVGPAPLAGGGQLAVLQAAFEGALPADLVADVLAACQGDAAAAMEALLGLSGGAAEGSAAPGASLLPQAAPPGAAAAAAASHASAAHPAAALPAGGPCYWDVLPQEVKELVFQQLSLRDLARAARACRQFASYVREQRRSLRTVVVPEGVSYTAVRSLVAAFAGASGVVLSRCAGQLRFPHEWEDMLRAVALGEADRLGSVPVSMANLARCGHATDATVATLCDTFTSLRRVDLSRCVEVGDSAMVRLAAYTRQPAGAAGESDSDGEGDWEEEEAASLTAGMEGIQLSYQAAMPATATKAAAAAGASPPGLESPDSAVRRIAVQRHEAVMAQTWSAARARHGAPLACGLEELVLRETSVSARGTKLLLQPGSATSKSLKVLDVSRCPNLGGDALDLHPRSVLEVLRAAGCNALRSVVIQLPAEAPLKALHLDGCRQLHEIILVAHQLDSLSLSHCGQLRHISLRCRRLRELYAVNCGSLNLAASELHCPALQHVNLFGCRTVDAEGLEAAAPTLAKCTALDLTGCTSLSRLLLPEAVELRSVSVSGCGLLRQVLLASPALTQFQAAGCSRLMELRLGTASLAVLDLENCSHLREVQLGEGTALAAPSADHQAAPSQGGVPPDKRKPSLVLRGCTSLPENAKKRLRAAVLGH